MSLEYIGTSREGEEEYTSLIRGVLADRYSDESDEEVQEIFESTLERIPEEDAQEIFGLITAAASSLLPTLIPKGVKLISGLVGRKRRRRRVYRRRRVSRVRRVRRRRRQGFSQRSAIKYMSKLILSPSFLNVLAGKLINLTSNRKVGKGKTRVIVRRATGRREAMDYTFEAYMNALSYLARSASNRNASSETGEYFDDDSETIGMSADGQAESMVLTLFGDEASYEDEFFEGDEFGEESVYEDEFDEEAGEEYAYVEDEFYQPQNGSTIY